MVNFAKKQEVKMSNQIEMVSLEDLVPKDNIHRRFEELFNFEKIKYMLLSLEKKSGRNGYGIVRLFKYLLYQFMEDLRSIYICRFISFVIKSKSMEGKRRGDKEEV
jgi:hypothetical protein